MSRPPSHGGRQRAASGHALALSRWEANDESWFEGPHFQLTSRRTDLQDLVGDGGTLWVVVSRRVQGRARYALRFRLDKCERHTYRDRRGFGKYAVYGDSNASALFASNDARLLLLALHFDPVNPIHHRSDRGRVIGASLQRPRALGVADVRLLRDFSTAIDRWSVFVCYERGDARLAKRLLEDLERRGVNTFRDQERLRAGHEWWPAIQQAIRRARLLVVLVGRDTAKSAWVSKEIALAKRHRVQVVPVRVAGAPPDALALLGLHRVQAVKYPGPRPASVPDEIAAEVRR